MSIFDQDFLTIKRVAKPQNHKTQEAFNAFIAKYNLIQLTTMQ